MTGEGRLFLHPCGCTERTDVEALAGRLEVRAGGCEIHGPAPTAADVIGEVADAMGLETFALAATRGARALLLELVNRHGVASRVALLAIERALAELDAAIRELEKLEGHGARRG